MNKHSCRVHSCKVWDIFYISCDLYGICICGFPDMCDLWVPFGFQSGNHAKSMWLTYTHAHKHICTGTVTCTQTYMHRYSYMHTKTTHIHACTHTNTEHIITHVYLHTYICTQSLYSWKNCFATTDLLTYVHIICPIH